MAGYIKLHRQILDNPIVCKDADHYAVWSYLLLNATHSKIDKVFAGKRVTLTAGQLITGRKKIAEKFNISESKVQRILKTFEIEQQIEQQTCPKNRLITVCGWNKYQSSEQQVNNNRTTSEQQVNTNKNVKKEKNDKNVKNKDIRFADFWSAYPKKVAKAEAEKAFNKIKIDDTLLTTILTAVEKQKQTEAWQKDKGQFIPYPATWLNQHRWEDEVIITNKANNFEGRPTENYDHLADDPFAEYNPEKKFGKKPGKYDHLTFDPFADEEQ